jgi:hypothetical protein
MGGMPGYCTSSICHLQLQKPQKLHARDYASTVLYVHLLLLHGCVLFWVCWWGVAAAQQHKQGCTKLGVSGTDPAHLGA